MALALSSTLMQINLLFDKHVNWTRCLQSESNNQLKLCWWPQLLKPFWCPDIKHRHETEPPPRGLPRVDTEKEGNCDVKTQSWVSERERRKEHALKLHPEWQVSHTESQNLPPPVSSTKGRSWGRRSMCLCDTPQKESEKLNVDQGSTAHLLEARWPIIMLPSGHTVNHQEGSFRTRR